MKGFLPLVFLVALACSSGPPDQEYYQEVCTDYLDALMASDYTKAKDWTAWKSFKGVTVEKIVTQQVEIRKSIVDRFGENPQISLLDYRKLGRETDDHPPTRLIYEITGNNETALLLYYFDDYNYKIYKVGVKEKGEFLY